MITFAFSAAALLALAGGDPDANPTPRPSPAVRPIQQAGEPSMQQRYCIRTETVNSRIRRDICRSRGQWLALTDVDPAELNSK